MKKLSDQVKTIMDWIVEDDVEVKVWIADWRTGEGVAGKIDEKLAALEKLNKKLMALKHFSDELGAEGLDELHRNSLDQMLLSTALNKTMLNCYREYLHRQSKSK
jgi:hypothetical protein